jgi:hypothetical protein
LTAAVPAADASSVAEPVADAAVVPAVAAAAVPAAAAKAKNRFSPYDCAALVPQGGSAERPI